MDFIFDPSLVLYLPFYELEGASFASRDAYGHLCIATGTSRRRGARYFDGNDDRLDFPSKITPVGAKTIEVVGFLESHDDVYSLVANHGNDETKYGIFFWVDNATKKLRVALAKGDGVWNFNFTGDTTLSLDRAYYLAFSWDGSTNANAVKLFVNGLLDAEGTALATETQNPSYNLRIGNIQPEHLAYNLKAGIWLMTMYAGALTPFEIQNRYPKMKELVGWL